MTTEEKISALAKIASEIKLFKGLEIARNAINSVPGEGDVNAEIFIIGEAPGRNEDATGRPFVGLAGKLMEKNLNSIGLKREDVFITSVVKYRPPKNRDPLPEEIEACKKWLDDQIDIVSPRIIVTLGRFSMIKFIPGVKISQVRGQPKVINFNNKEFIIYPLYHPAAAMRSRSMKQSFEQDFKKLAGLLKKGSTVASEAKKNDNTG